MKRRGLVRTPARFSFEPLDRRLQFSGDTGTVIPVHAAPTAAEFKEIGVNLGGLTYYSNFWPFADALKMESRGWMLPGGYASVANANLDATGDPTVAGTYHAEPFQNNTVPGYAPSGVYVVTWDGDGDVTIGTKNATLISGSAADHRRVYRLAPGGWPLINMTNNVTGDGHVTNVHAWMPDPTDPQNLSLEPAAGQTRLWHPQYLDHLRDLAASTGYLRFMDWENTNSSPQVNWSDRRPANHEFATGDTNYKLEQVPGESTTRYGTVGVPWEYVIDLCNTLGLNAWINVPHAATDDYVHQLAKLFAGPSDTSTGLNAGLRVYVEYSNEIWSGGGSFRQGDWAQQQANALGISKAQFNAKRSVEIFRIFDQEFSAAPAGPRAGDIIRVAAAFTGQTTSYTTPYLAAMDVYAHSYANEPAYTADVLAVTTYFGGASLIKYAFNQTNWLNANLNDPNDPVINQIFDYWTTELSLGPAGTGNGTEGNVGAGGFGTAMATLAQQYGLKLVSYEGGPSIYTETTPTYLKDGKIVDSTTAGATVTYSLANYVQANYADDNNNPYDADRFTKLLMALNRHPRIAEVYAAVLETAKAQGLKTHALFTDISNWSKYGQWGHMEYLGQPVDNVYGDAVKWNYIKNYGIAEGAIHDADEVVGAAPVLPASQMLGQVFAGDAYAKTLATTPGDGSGDAIRYQIVAGALPTGMSLAKVSDSSIQFTGTPTTTGTYRFLVRALDADNDPAYADYSLTVLPTAGSSTSFATNNDTFADQNGTTPGSNGANKYLYVSNTARTSYVKFDIGAQTAGKVDRVVLRVYLRDYENGITPTIGGQLWVESVGDTLRDGTTVWTENNLSSATSPTATGIIGSVKTLAPNAGGYYEFDVTNYAKAQLALGNTTIDLAIRGRVLGGPSQYTAIRLASKEYAGGAYAPKVIVSTSPATAASPPQVLIQPIGPNPHVGGVGTISVVFDRPVTGVDLGDFSLARDGTTISLANATLSTSDNVTYTIANTAVATRSAGTYILTLNRDGSEVRDAAGTLLGAGDSEDWLATGFTGAPTKLTTFTLDDGTLQRSRVRTATLTFNGTIAPEAIASDAITLTQTAGTIKTWTVGVSSVTTANGVTTVKLTFGGAGLQSGSLADGRFALKIDGAKITDVIGRPVDVAASGTDGSAATFGFTRLFADMNGDGTDDVSDLGLLATLYGSTIGSAGYTSALDVNDDGVINVVELGELSTRYGTSIPAAPAAAVATTKPAVKTTTVKSGTTTTAKPMAKG